MTAPTDDYPELHFGQSHHIPPMDSPGVASCWTIRVAALVALIASTALAKSSIQGGDLFGCNALPQFDCEHILKSPWAKWLGIPVSLPGVAVYAAILLGSFLIRPRVSFRVRHIAWVAISGLSLLAAGSAVWFLGLMAVELEKICLYCLVAHSCGLTIATLVLWHIVKRPREGARRSGRAWMNVLRSSTDRPKDKDAAAEETGLGDPSIERLAASHTVMVGLVALTGVSALIGGQLLFPTKQYEVESIAEFLPEDPSAEDLPAWTNPAPVVENPPSVPDIPSVPDVPSSPDNNAPFASEQPMVPEDPVTVDPGTPTIPPEVPATVEVWPPLSPITVGGGTLHFNPAEHPLVGSPKATHVLLKMFDYTCRHCRQMHEHLEAARDRYGDQIAIVVTPIPMNTNCNKYVEQTHSDHRRACEYAELALAVWMSDQSKFEEFHNWLFSMPRPPLVTDATARAVELIGQEALDRARTSPELARRREFYVEFFHTVGGGGLPKLFTDRHVIKGEPRQTQEFFDVLEGLLKVVPRKP